MTAIEEKNGLVLLRVRVQPRASRNALLRDAAGNLRVALTAPPVDGSANKALCHFIAKQLGISRSAVVLTAGEKSRDKTLALSGLAFQEVAAKIDACAVSKG